MKKRILILFTGWTVAWNVAKTEVSEHKESNWEDFMKILENSVEIVKHNWSIEIKPEVVELFNVDSSNIQPENWTRLISEIEEKYDEFDAFIVLHWTNTMWYTTSALSFALSNINKPVIFTWAQVPLWYLWSDAITNLVNALRLSVWWYHEIKWVMAVFGSKIISWTRVKKWTDFDYDPFKSFQAWNLWDIWRFMRIHDLDLKKHLNYLSSRKPLAIQSRMLNVKKNFDMNSIASITEFPGMSVNIFKLLVENDSIKAFVFRSFWAWDPSSHLFPAFKYLKNKKIPIIVTTQAPSWISNFQVNETGQYLRENDLAIPAHNMSIESMTVKMAWLLAQNKSYDEIKTLMITDLHWEIDVESELI